MRRLILVSLSVMVVLLVLACGCGDKKQSSEADNPFSEWIGDGSAENGEIEAVPGPRYDPYPAPDEASTATDYDIGLGEGYEEGYWAGYYDAVEDSYDNEPPCTDYLSVDHRIGYHEGYFEGYDDGYYDCLDMLADNGAQPPEMDEGDSGDSGEDKSEGEIIDLTDKSRSTGNLKYDIVGTYVGNQREGGGDILEEGILEAIELKADGTCINYYVFYGEGSYWIDTRRMEIVFGGDDLLMAGEGWLIREDPENTEFENAYKLIDEEGNVWRRGEPLDPSEYAL